ncbi:hypothetical protein [Nocardioides sp. SYSU D00065]|uniref:hypothetical protein n=1 Tax=Nocardioides sp. SYSU D00065 TaxID=2817378 RepID=UPI001B3452D5|nr:hypothetical protein [Nocardioides sp. SYSU D00065]
MKARDVGRRFGRANALVVAMIVVLSGLLVGLHVDGYTKLSPVDELQHIDYLDRAPGHPSPTDRVGQFAMHQQLCRGMDFEGFGPPGCVRGRLDPDNFQERGYNTASIYTPLYYTATKVVASGIELVTPADDLVTSGRLVGGFWLALGALLLFAAGRRRGLDRGPLAAICVLLVSGPALLYPSSTIAPDATALALSAGLVLALTWVEERPTKRRIAVLVLIATIAPLVKMTYLCSVAVVALYLLIRWLRGLQRGERAHWPLVTGAVAAVTALAGTFAWTSYVSSMPQISDEALPDMATRFQVGAFPWYGIGDSLFVLLQPLSNPWVLVGTPQLVVLACTLGTLTVTAGTVATAIFGVGQEREQDLARATIISGIACSIGLIVISYVTSGSYIPLPSRYGMALIAPLALSTVACVRTRTSSAILWGIAAASLVLTLWRLVDLNLA